jgi:hypothetical protein
VVSNFELAYATIVRDHQNGLFDVTYKREGFTEYRVPRARLRPAEAPGWQVVYRGKETSFGLVNLVPDYVIEREPGYQVVIAFALRTLGVDYPKGEVSLLGDIAVCSTRNPHPPPAPRNPPGRRVMEIGELILYAWDGKYWGDGVGNHYT